MNVRIKKELRPLLGIFSAAVVVAVGLSMVLTGHDASGIVTVVFTGFCALMGASVFGNEFQTRTMPMLLAQPAPRQRIWREKMQVLGAALAVSYAAACVSMAYFFHGEARGDHLGESIGILFLLMLCVFSTTPCLSLFCRNIIGAAAFAAVVPMALIMLVVFLAWAGSWLTSHPGVPLFADWFDQNPYPGTTTAIVCVIYCAIFYRLGYRKFMGLQVVDVQGTEIALPAGVGRFLAPALKKLLPGYTGPLASLIRKELLLQRVSYIILVVASAALLGEAVVWKLHPSDVADAILLATFGIYVLIIPFITGVVSMAEERNWGTMGWQLTLPVSPLRQWTIKILVANFTAVILGLLVPRVMLVAQQAMGTRLAYVQEPNWTIYVLAYLLVFNLIVFASSISLNSMRAATVALGLLIAGVGVVAAALYYVDGVIGFNSQFAHAPDAMDQRVIEMGLILVLGLVLYLTLANYRKGESNARRGWIQVFVILLSMGCATTSGYLLSANLP